MAAGPLLISEPLQRYRALGLAGDPVWRAAGQLRAAIAQRLSRRHADLLAVPEVDPTGRRIDWYAPFEGQARKLSELDEGERQAILNDVHRLHSEITGLADSMDEPQRSTAERNFARLLRHALTAPGEDTLYVVDGKPVMTFWGFSADANLPGVFLASPPVTPRPNVGPRVMPEAVMASAPAIAAGTRSAWWQWLLLAVLLLLLLALLAWLVRPYLPRLEPWLEAEARDRALSLAVRQPVELQKARADTLQQDNKNLRLELARLTDEAARRGADCAAAVVVPGGVVVADSNAPIERGAAPDALAAGPGAIMADKDAGKDQPQGKGPDDKNVDKGNMKGPDPQDKGGPDRGNDKNTAGNDPKKDEPKPMTVPPEAKQKQDLAFLKGDWRSRTGLATATGERDLRPNYTLDDKGKGKVTFVQKNGTTCEAPAEARWDGSKLMIEEKANPKCADGKTYARNTVNCEVGQDGVAKCTGSQPGDKRSYNVQFGR
jgi:hypothetical protein